jgi:ubiquinone biosynthesis monooxygenase Coq6
LDQDIGAWEYIDQSRVQPYFGMEVWDGLTDSRITFDWNSTSDILGYQPASALNSKTIAYMIENINLTTGLRKYLTKLGGTTVLSPARVESISYGPVTEDADLSSWPKVNLADGQSLIARLLVGADGANSPVRTFAGIQTRGWDYSRMGVVATLRLASPPRRKIAFQRFLPSGPVAMLPLPGNMASLVWSTTPERAAVLKTLAMDDFSAIVNAAFRLSAVDIEYLHSIQSGQADEVTWREKHLGTPGVVPERVATIQENTVAAFPLKLRHADSYTADRIALVGSVETELPLLHTNVYRDAAHTIHPLAGQGLNQGQGDVASLVRTIETAMQSGQDIGSSLSLEPYNSERYAANNTLLGVCDKLHKLYSFESGPIVPLRSIGLRAVNQLGFLKGYLMRTAAGGA